MSGSRELALGISGMWGRTVVVVVLGFGLYGSIGYAHWGFRWDGRN